MPNPKNKPKNETPRSESVTSEVLTTRLKRKQAGMHTCAQAALSLFTNVSTLRPPETVVRQKE